MQNYIEKNKKTRKSIYILFVSSSNISYVFLQKTNQEPRKSISTFVSTKRTNVIIC